MRFRCSTNTTRRGIVPVVIVEICVLLVLPSNGSAQEKGDDGITRDPAEGVPEWALPYMFDEQGKPRAHIHNPDMSCCKPCVPTDADRDPDVFRRPCFARALVRSRETVRAFVYGLTGGPRDGIHVGAERIPAQDIEGFQSLLTTVLKPGSVPRAWEEIEFYGSAPCPTRTISEMRNGVKTFVRQELDCNAEVKVLKDGDAIQTAWTVDGIEVLPRVRRSTQAPKGMLIRLRLHGDERLVLKPRPADFVRAGVLADNFGDFFDKAAFHALLAKVFRVPFESPEDFLVDGYDTEITAGARVFTGKIRSRDRVTQLKADRWAESPHWWDEMRLLVTDSDPQYFCVRVMLRENDLSPQDR